MSSQSKNNALDTGKSPRRKWLERLLFILLFLIVALGIAVWALWVNRNLVMEQALRRALAARGYDAVVSIESVTETQAILNNISLKHNGEIFLEAKQFNATYSWPEVKSGIFNTITIDGLELNLEVNESFTPVSAWLPQSSDGTGGTFPKDGVSLTRSKITVRSPYGILPLSGDISVPSLTRQTAKLELKDAQLSYGEASALLEGAFDIEREAHRVTFRPSELVVIEAAAAGVTLRQGNIVLEGEGILPFETSAEMSYSGQAMFAAESLSSQSLLARPVAAHFEGLVGYNLNAEALNFDGYTDYSAGPLDHKAVSANSLFVSYSGTADHTFGRVGIPFMQGQLKFESQALTLKNSEQRKALSENFAMHQILSAAPIAEQFHESFTQLMETVLGGSAVTVSADIGSDSHGYEVSLKDPAIIEARSTHSIIVSPGPAPLLAYRADRERLMLGANLALNGERSLELTGLNVAGTSKTGGLWSDIEVVKTRVSSGQMWQSETARLAPFTALIDYAKSPASKAMLKVSSDVNYDGPLLGYRADGLNAAGDLQLDIAGGKTAVSYKTENVLTADRFETPLGWAAENVSLRLVGQTPLISQSPTGAQLINLDLADISAHMIETRGTRDFQVSAQAAQIFGELGGAQERWDVALTESLITSDNTPVPETRMKMGQVEASVTRGVANDVVDPWNYELKTPAIDANIKPLRLRAMALSLSGSGGDFTADYSGGTVNLDGQSLPNMPMRGQAIYKDGALSGTAETALPRAPKFPVYLTYQYQDGRGSAEMDIPSFVFRDGGVQPQDLAPILKGKVAAVEGRASANVTLGFVSGQPLTSKGTVTLEDMNIGTLVGPFEGVSTTLNFDSLLPLKSAGTQNITMRGFNPGLPLGEGTLSFDVIEGGIDIHSAQWPLGEGRIWLEPTIWRTGGGVNEVSVSVANIDIGDLMMRFGNENMSATGKINGRLPIRVDGVDVRVVNGRLSVDDGGVIRVRTDGLDAAAEKNETAKIAIDALKEFEYQSLTLDVNGPLDGNIILGSVFTGRNADVLGGAEFLFRVTIEGELINIAKNFANNAKVEEFVRMLETGAP